MRKTISILMLSSLLSYASMSEARDPKVDEMAPIFEIAGFLRDDCAEAYSRVASVSAYRPQLRRLLWSMERLSEKASAFYDSAYSNSRAPWRTVSAYRELNQAFQEASAAFGERDAYLADPSVFEEIAFLMGGLLQYYQEQVYQVTVPGYGYGYGYGNYGAPYPVYPTYPLVVYPWIPRYYSFANIRFANVARYPWAKGVIVRTR